MLLKFNKVIHQNSEAGNTTIIALVLTAAAMVGISQMLDSSVLTRQNIANQDLNNQQKDTPRSATILAKALINRPASAETNLKDNWTSAAIKVDKSRLPAIYPSPYVAGSSGSPAARPTFLSKSVSTADVKSPFDASAVGTTNKIKVYTLDSGRSANDKFDKAFINPGKAVNNEDDATVIPRTESRVTYNLSDCDKDGKTSTGFTGYYCASADIESDTYSRASNGNLTKSTVVNKGIANLGMIPVPPAPSCGLITSSIGATGNISPGRNFDLSVTASGVAVGYAITLKVDGNAIGAPIESPEAMTAYKWNTLGADGTETITINTSAYESQMPANSKLTADVSLTAIDGTKVDCPGSFQLKILTNKPSCELRPVQAKRFYQAWDTACDQPIKLAALVVKINGIIPVTANPVITKYANKTTVIPRATWTTIQSPTPSWWTQPVVYPCADGPCFQGEMGRNDFLQPGWYEVRVTGTNGQNNTCSAFLFGDYDNSWRCPESRSTSFIGRNARTIAQSHQIPFPNQSDIMANDTDTANKNCSMVGKKVGYRNSLSSEMRTNHTTCGNNQHVKWNGRAFVLVPACSLEWLGTLVCN